MKTVRKPVKKAINVSLRKLVLQLEEKLPLFFKHVATITHQYQTISELKKKLTDNEVLIHIDFSNSGLTDMSGPARAAGAGDTRRRRPGRCTNLSELRGGPSSTLYRDKNCHYCVSAEILHGYSSRL
ncbi:hypothetical protein EVAR_31332_1 [Eumeta japonica]|uniref:Uncharacterized protein n=1 Tax=Eumeta variegata TaxID=151549 RepID=A0A4C1Y0M1_EUMVA|nr:hypothetical protein EVAR_31332_1 [Eumeta japonica]